MLGMIKAYDTEQKVATWATKYLYFLTIYAVAYNNYLSPLPNK